MKLAWQQIPHYTISEIFCTSEFDGIVLDTEHGCFNNESLYMCIQTITLKNKKCFVRLTEVNKTMIRYCLDAGVDGLIFSTVESVEQSENIHNYCNFPTQGGTRGLGLVRANSWGKNPNLTGKKPLLVAQIESEKGVSNLKDIADFNFDYYLIGPYDLSMSMKIPQQFDDEKFMLKIKNIHDIIGEEKLGIHIPSEIDGQINKYKNFGLLALGMDTTMLIDSLKKLEKY
jgi:2-keto-3-deoxy-L-rhamnonate aldolase RhmA